MAFIRSKTVKRLVVAAYRSEIRPASLARRFGIDGSTVKHWAQNPEFADVQPLDEAGMKKLPPDPVMVRSGWEETTGLNLVRISPKPAVPAAVTRPSVDQPAVVRARINIGALSIEFLDGFSSPDVMAVLKALGGSDVL